MNDIEEIGETVDNLKFVMENNLPPEFIKVCDWINRELLRRIGVTKTYEILRDWGVTGKETDWQVRMTIEDYINFLKD